MSQVLLGDFYVHGAEEASSSYLQAHSQAAHDNLSQDSLHTSLAYVGECRLPLRASFCLQSTPVTFPSLDLPPSYLTSLPFNLS